MHRQKLLIATKNPGKIQEITHALETQPFDLVSLLDFPEIPAPEEPYDLIELNAIAKAKYYGEKTGLLALADDSGIFVDALGGWPGVHSARIGENDDDRMQKVLDKIKDVSSEQRTASFQCVLAVYHPKAKSFHTTFGSETGILLETPVTERRNGFGFDPIFFLPELGKTYAEIPIEEKNKISHRAKALHQMEYVLKKEFGARHIVVPCGFIIQNGQLYMQKRNDPFRPDYHNKWEFPGGGVELGEQLKENCKREILEETGLEVEVLTLLQHIQVEAQEYPEFSYQVYLVPYVCKVIGGKLDTRDHEVLEAKWFDIEDVTNHELLGTNRSFFEKIKEELILTIQKHNL